MGDVRPETSDRNRPDASMRPDPIRLTAAADELQQAVGELAREIASGGAFGKEDARDRFEIALADFSALIDSTAT